VLNKPTHKATPVGGLVELELQPPSGYYDLYTLTLIKRASSTSPNTSLVFIKNFASPTSSPLRLEFLVLNTDETLKSGYTYEMYATTQRRLVAKSNQLKFNQLKSENKPLHSFKLKPDPPEHTRTYVLTNTSVNVTWVAPLFGTYQAFAIKYFASNATQTTNERITNRMWCVIEGVDSAEVYFVEIKACADELCHVYSDLVGLKVDLGGGEKKKRVVGEFLARNLSFAGGDEESTGLGLGWRLRPETSSDVCDLGGFRLQVVSLRGIGGNETKRVDSLVPSQVCKGSWKWIFLNFNGLSAKS
jgi:hypothetical protein